MCRTLVALALLLLSAASAHADEATARQRFDAGERAYNLGQFQRAIDLFKEAYEQLPDPAFLFNIAQTYRQAGDCKQAQFFYKRFLALKATDTKKPLKPERKAEVEQRITELEECIKRELANKPPDTLDHASPPTTGDPAKPAKPANPTTPANATTPPQTGQVDQGGDEGGDEDEEPPVPTSDAPKLMSARAIAGAAKLNAESLDTPVQFAVAIVGGYPLALANKVTLEVGAAFTFTPVPFTTGAGVHGSGGLVGLLVNAGPSLLVAPKLSVRADVGIGAQLFTGLGTTGNPFTDGGTPASGALSTFLVRAGASVDYAITPNLVLTAAPITFTYSPAPDGFKPMITSLTTLAFYAGLGYRR